MCCAHEELESLVLRTLSGEDEAELEVLFSTEYGQRCWPDLIE